MIKELKLSLSYILTLRPTSAMGDSASKLQEGEASEMAQGERIFTFAQGLGLIPSSHTVVHNHL